MLVSNKHYRTIWLDENDPSQVQIIDQRYLPHQFKIESIRSVDNMATAIKEMHVRGAGLIGAAAAYGMYLATLEMKKTGDENRLEKSAVILKMTRPTAINLEWAVDRQWKAISDLKSIDEKVEMALSTAKEIANEDASYCHDIGQHGLPIIQDISRAKAGKTVNILTHCNAGWLAFVDYGSATSPIYAAQQQGIDLHIWVDETRPRNQGASLTAWELLENNIPHSVIVDNAGGHLMQQGLVDLVIVGSDRTTYTGDVANKIGTYLKALSAYDNHVPFYVALPSSTIDWKMSNGIEEIPIELRNPDEVKYINGFAHGENHKVLLTPKGSNAVNYAFDVTPSRLITGLITEKGLCKATEEGIRSLFPEKSNPVV